MLEVHDVGDYVATFVPSLKDFGRVDPPFVLPRDVWDRIPTYADYGFAVFQLKELSGSPHPIALEFDTRTPEALFFPTVHIHDGTVHGKDDFDHVLYAQEALFDGAVDSYEGPAAVDARTGYVRSHAKAATFTNVANARGLIDGNLLVHRTTLLGILPNTDTLIDVHAVLRRKAGAAAATPAWKLGPRTCPCPSPRRLRGCLGSFGGATSFARTDVHDTDGSLAGAVVDAYRALPPVRSSGVARVKPIFEHME